MKDGEGEALARRHGGVAVSALRRTGLRGLLARAERLLWVDGEDRIDRLGTVDPQCSGPARPHML